MYFYFYSLINKATIFRFVLIWSWNMKYWHPHLPFGQHISVSTLVILKNKCMYVYLIFLGSISVRFCFSISCMISLHGLSHGSSSAFRLHSVRTFCFSKLLWFGSSWQCFLVGKYTIARLLKYYNVGKFYINFYWNCGQLVQNL
jgi:hypothetical protein